MNLSSQQQEDESYLDSLCEFYLKDLESDIVQLKDITSKESLDESIYEYFLDDESNNQVQSVNLNKGDVKTSSTEDIDLILRNKKIRKAALKKSARHLRTVRSLVVPADDIRRLSSKFLFECFHNANFKKLGDFLHGHAFEYLLFKYQSTNNSPAKSQVILPSNVDIRGIDAFVSFVEAISRVKPDQIFIVSDTTIRNTVRSCSITTKFTAMGTSVYELLLRRRKSDNGDKKTSNKSRKIDDEVTNLTNLCGKVESLDIYQSVKGEKLDFDKGVRLNSMVANKGEGTLTIHFLNKERKIHLIEYKVHYDDL